MSKLYPPATEQEKQAVKDLAAAGQVPVGMSIEDMIALLRQQNEVPQNDEDKKEN